MSSVDNRLMLVLAFEERLRAAQAERDKVPLPLHGGGGGSTSGGMSEDWKANVDRQLEQLHGDVRNLLYGIVGSFVVLGGMVGGLYVRADSKFEAVETRAQSRAEKADDRLAKIEATLAAINAKLDERTSK